MKKIWAKLSGEIAGIHYYEATVLLLVPLLFIIVGSFADYSIANALYHPNNFFGNFFAYAGPYPAAVLFGAGGVLFFIDWKSENRQDSKILAIISACIFPILAGALYGYESLSDGISNKYLAILLGVIAVGVGDFAFYFLARHADKDEAYRAGVTFLLSGATIMVLIYLLKKAGLRPRFYWMETQSNPADYFRNWWDFDPTVKEGFADNPLYQDTFFESWPSGHAAFAGTTVLSVVLAKLNPKWKNKASLFLLFSLLWTILVSLARISDGNHFLSDVGFGSFFGILFPLLIIYLVYLPIPSEEELEEEKNEKPQPKKPLSLAGKRFEKNQPRVRVYQPKKKRKNGGITLKSF